MKPVKTIFISDIWACDLLMYRPSSFFGLMIKFFDAMRYGRIDIAFSHVATAIHNQKWELQRYDAMEWYRTWFRNNFENCYTFSLDLTEEEIQKMERHFLSRGGSKYDRKGILSFFTPIEEDEFCDYCSELYKNALYYTRYWDMLSLWEKKLSPMELYTLLRPYLTFKGLVLW